MDGKLTALEAEVAEFRRLAEANPRTLYPGLAFTLSDLSSLYHDLDRRDDSLAAASEAADVFSLASRHDPEFRAPLAMALNNLCARQQDCGDPAAALATARRAADAAADLPADEPTAPTIMAAARFNMATQLFLLGEDDQGEAVLTDMARTIRQLLDSGRHETAALQINILQDFANRAREHGNWAEHVALRRALSLALPGDPPAGRAALAYALDQAAAEAVATDPARASTWAGQATALFERLAEQDPIKYALGLAQARTLRAMSQEDCGDCDADAAWGEAVAAWRALPDCERRLATALGGEAGALERNGRVVEAIDRLTEASALWRARPAMDAATDGALFADVLRRLSRLLLTAGRHVEALAVANEGLDLVLSSVMQAGLGSRETLEDLEALRRECLEAQGRAS